MCKIGQSIKGYKRSWEERTVLPFTSSAVCKRKCTMIMKFSTQHPVTAQSNINRQQREGGGWEAASKVGDKTETGQEEG